MRINGWEKTHDTKDMMLWQKGEAKPNPLHLRHKYIKMMKTSPYIRKEFGNRWDVHAYKRINPDTIHGGVKSFQTKRGALEFVRNFMRRN